MKMILSIINKHDSKAVVQGLIRGGYQVTRLSSSGGFMQMGTVTILSGMKDERVEKALDIIRENSRKRTFSQFRIPNETKSVLNYDKQNNAIGEIVMGGASCFVLSVDEFLKF